MSRFLQYSCLSNISQLMIVVKNYAKLLQTHNHGKTIKRIFSKEITRVLRGCHCPWSWLCLLKVSHSISQKPLKAPETLKTYPLTTWDPVAGVYKMAL